MFPLKKLALCPICGKYLNSSGKLKYHMLTHTGERPHTCSVCGNLFQQAGTLKIHMRIHTGEKPYQCQTCGKSYTSSSKLGSHVLRNHVADRPRNHHCTICSAVFMTIVHLKQHQEAMHLKLKPHKCPFCDRAFNGKGTLKRHVYIHTGEKPYKCTLCDAAFNQSQLLSAHMKKIHSNVLSNAN